MINRYKARDNKIYIIKDMKDEHLLNAHCYFAVSRLKMIENSSNKKQ